MAYVVALAISIGIFAVVAVAYDLIFGHAGLFSAASIAYYATGAYVGAIVLHDVTDQFLAGAVAAVGAAYALGWLTARVTLHLIGDYFVVGTLGLHALVLAVLINWTSVTGGSAGYFGITRPTFGSTTLPSNNAVLALVLVTLAAVSLFSWRLIGAPFGRLLHAVRDDPIALASLGYDPTRLRGSIFAASAGMSGLAGVLYASYVTFIDPSSFTLDPLILVLAMVVIGGTGTVVGPLLGALVVFVVPEVLRYVHFGALENRGYLQNAIFGALLILIVIVRPQGLLPEAVVERWRRQAAARETRAREDGPGAVSRLSVVAPEVDVQGLSKSFGGVQALRDVSFMLQPGRVTSVIGPNGAGKSTLLACIAGSYRPDAGTVQVGGVEITGRPAHELLRHGVGRTFQDPRLFGTMTVLENVDLGHPRRHGRTIASSILRPRAVAEERARIRTHSVQLVHWVGLTTHGDRPARELSGGQQKLLALARTLATQASVVLLDEPTAGVSPALVPELVDRVKELREGGHTVCLIEHQIDVVRELSDWVVVLENGEIVLQGEPESVLASKQLEDLYIGRVEADRALGQRQLSKNH